MLLMEKKRPSSFESYKFFSILCSILAYQNTHIRTFQKNFDSIFLLSIIFTIFEHQRGGF